MVFIMLDIESMENVKGILTVIEINTQKTRPDYIMIWMEYVPIFIIDVICINTAVTNADGFIQIDAFENTLIAKLLTSNIFVIK